jgi:hypothetical protein
VYYHNNFSGFKNVSVNYNIKLFYILYIINATEGHRQGVFKNRVLRRLFGPKRDELMGGWRKLENEELYNLHSPPTIIKMLK